MTGPRYGEIDHEYGLRLASTPAEADGPVWMLNLMKYRRHADYADGRETNLTGREADDAYTPIESLTAVGAEIVFAADVDAQLLGESPTWDRVAVVKYPTRRSFIDMQARPEFQTQHAHKDAGMEQTIVMGLQPIGDPTQGIAPEQRPSWDDVPHPPTAQDGPVVVLHVIRFETDGGAEEMVNYQRRAATSAGPHGVRVRGWFEAEGTIIGDGRTWDQARFNAFPSKAAFMAVVTDPERLKAQREHREPAIADTYALILRPMIDQLEESTAQ